MCTVFRKHTSFFYYLLSLTSSSLGLWLGALTPPHPPLIPGDNAPYGGEERWKKGRQNCLTCFSPFLFQWMLQFFGKKGCERPRPTGGSPHPPPPQRYFVDRRRKKKQKWSCLYTYNSSLVGGGGDGRLTQQRCHGKKIRCTSTSFWSLSPPPKHPHPHGLVMPSTIGR